MQDWCPFAERRVAYDGSDKDKDPNANFSKGNDGRDAVVLHIMQGGFDGSVDWFENFKSDVSAHFSIAKDGRIAQSVALSDSSYANGLSQNKQGKWLNVRGNVVKPTWPDLRPKSNPNRYTISIEHEGTTGEPLTPAMVASQTRLLRWLAAECGLVYVAGKTLIRHADLDTVDRKFCPGSAFDLEEIARMANMDNSKTAEQTLVIGTKQSTDRDHLLRSLKRNAAQLSDEEMDRVCTLAEWLDIDMAAVLSMWAVEGGLPYGSSPLQQQTRNPLNIKAQAGDRRAVYTDPVTGGIFLQFESMQLGILYALLHLKAQYGAKGLLTLQDIIPVWAPATDNNDPDNYIKKVQETMIYIGTH